MKRLLFLAAAALLPYVAGANALQYTMAMRDNAYTTRVFSGAVYADPKAGSFARTEQLGGINHNLGYLSAASGTSFSPTVIPQVRNWPNIRDTIRAHKTTKLSVGPSEVKKERLSARIYGLAGIFFSIGLLMFILFSDSGYLIFIPALMVAGLVLMILSMAIALIAFVVSAIEWVGRIFKKKPKPGQEEAPVG